MYRKIKYIFQKESKSLNIIIFWGLAAYFLFCLLIVRVSDIYLSVCYTLVIFIGILAYGYTFSEKYRKTAYIVFAISFIIFLIMNKIPAIKNQFDADDCINVGKVWDYSENRCRDDCLTWNKVNGCIQLPEE